MTGMTIAVLPFLNISADAAYEYFSDGITEEIINALAKIRELKVTSRTSSFFYKGQQKPLGEIGKELGVSTILEGSVRLAGNRVRITAQLIDVAEDVHFWSETWDKKLENIFEIQDEVSLLIAEKLREQLGHFDIQEHLVEKQTDNIDAYSCSLKAKFLRNKWNPEDVREALSLYERALELDPNHDESYTGLADCYSFLGTTGFMPFDEAWKLTIRYTRKALSLNSKSSGAYYQLSNYSFFVEANYGKSLREMIKAVELNPNNAEAHEFLSFQYIIAGNRVKALEHLEIALALNPLSEQSKFFKGYFHYMIEDYAEALDLLNNCLVVNDKNIPAHSIKPLCLLKMGRYDEVISYYDNIPPHVVIEGEKTGAIALAWALKKDDENMSLYEHKLGELTKGPHGQTADSYLFLLYAVRGEADRAFNWVGNAIDTGNSLLFLRYTDPLVAPITHDPRYQGFKQTIYHSEAEKKSPGEKPALLDPATTADFTNRLMAHISTEKPYLNPDLSLRELARQIDMHPNQLSWVLNQGIGKNFNEFINQFRIEAFKSVAREQVNQKLTIEGMAYESGFNSKTVFNTCFKKETGLTPTQYLRQHV